MDQDGARQRPDPRGVFEQNGEVAGQPHERSRQRTVDEVVIDGEDADEADVREELVQFRAAQQVPGVGVSEPSRDVSAECQEQVPWITLVEHDFSTRFEQLVRLLHDPGAVLLIQQIHADDKVEPPSHEVVRKRMG